MLEAQFLFEEDGQFITGNRVRNNRAARIIRSENGGHHGDKCITADFLAVFEYGTHAINVRIENQAQICTAVQHCFFDGCHSLLVFGVGDVIGEVPIRFQKDAAGSIGTQTAQDLRSKEAACTIAGIHHNVHAFQGFILPAQSLTDFLAQVMTIAFNQIVFLNLSQIPFYHRIAGGIFEDGDDFIMLHTAVLGEELEAIAVVGQVTCRNHNGAVHLGFRENDGHKHSRRRSQTAIHCYHSCRRQSVQDCLFEVASRQAGIMADSNAQVFFLLAGLVSQKIKEPAGNDIRCISAQGHRLVCHAFNGHTTHITAVSQLHQILFWNNHR